MKHEPFSILNNSISSLNSSIEKLRNKLNTFDCEPQEIPAILTKIDRLYKRLLELELNRLKKKCKSDHTNLDQLALTIYNKHANYDRVDEADMKLIHNNGTALDIAEFRSDLNSLSNALQFEDDKKNYLTRVKKFLNDLKHDLKNRDFMENRLMWVHEDEHHPYYLSYEWDINHTPWEMKDVKKILRGLDTDKEADCLQAFADISKLFKRAMHPMPSLLRRDMDVNTKKFYQEQITLINELSFVPPTTVVKEDMAPTPV